MSAWLIGTGRDEPSVVGAGSSEFKRFIDKITVWIPGDVMVIYVAGVTALLTQNGRPSFPFLIVMVGVTLALVPFAAWVAGKPLTRKVWTRAVLAVIAFLVWSLTVPESGWWRLDLVSNNPGWVSVIAALAGLFFGLLAEKISPTT